MGPRRPLKFNAEELESRFCLSAVTFVTHDIVRSAIIEPQDLRIADLDGDGDQDLLFASRVTKTVEWLPNVDGRGAFGPQRGITANAVNLIDAGDIDGDGYTDVVSLSEDLELVWHQNEGTGRFQQQHVIGTHPEFPPGGVPGFIDFGSRMGDVDGDGDLDVMFSVVAAEYQDMKFVWYENLDGRGTFGAPQIIAQPGPPVGWSMADVDGDRDLDYVYIDREEEQLQWLENHSGDDEFSEPRIIDAQVEWNSNIVAFDVDSDDDQDIVFTRHWPREERGLYVLLNTDGQGAFAEARPLIAGVSGSDLSVCDIDLDGDLDLLYEDFFLEWHENLGGGVFRAEGREIGSIRREFELGDITGDGAPDAVAIEMDSIVSYENADGRGDFGSQHVISPRADGVYGAFLTDVDGDSDVDILYADYHDELASWYENVDGQGMFAGPRTSQWVNGSYGDIDGDGDLDAITSVYHFDMEDEYFEVVWYQDARGDPLVISRFFDSYGPGTYLADVDGDGDNDAVVLRGDFHEYVYWHENTDGRGAFGPARDFPPANGEYVDLDNDGDQDIVVNDEAVGKLRWLENRDGQGTHVWRDALFDDYVSVISTGDMDGDGDQDLIAGDAWHENDLSSGQPVFNKSHALPHGFWVMRTKDLDQDGDLDLIGSFSRRPVWLENLDGSGQFGAAPLSITVGSGYEASGIHIADIDGDGDLDVFTEGRDVFGWHESRLIGDVNDSGVFDSSDLVKVAVHGKYETGIPATFNEGDWNHDGVFTTADLVAAFKAGHYAAALRPSVGNVAAAVDLFFADDEDRARGYAP